MKQVRHAKVFVVLCLFSFVLHAQHSHPSSVSQSGKIAGVVLDINDARIADATVIIERAKFKRELRSGDAGEFEIELPAGVYQITVEKHGFNRFVVESLKVKPKVTEMINIHMNVMVIRDPY